MSAQPAAQQSVRLHRGWALLHGSGLSLRPPFPERESPHSVAVRRHCQLLQAKPERTGCATTGSVLIVGDAVPA
jgi:hypothetical protein